MTLEEYFRANLERTDPHPIIDHVVRVQEEGDRLRFYIHPADANGDTLDFYIDGDKLLLIDLKLPKVIEIA